MKHGTTPALELALALTPEELQSMDIAFRAGPWEGLPNLVERHWPEDESVVYDTERESWMIFLTPEETWRFPQGANLYLDVRPVRTDGQVPETPLVDLGRIDPSFFRDSAQSEDWVEGAPNDKVEVTWKDTHCVVTVDVDDTLTRSGVPADAQAAGNRLTQLEEKVGTQEEKTATLEEKVGTQEEKTAALEEKVGTREEKTTALEEKTATLEEKVGTQEEKTAALEEKVETQEEKITAMEEKTAALEESLSQAGGGTGVQLTTGSWTPTVEAAAFTTKLRVEYTKQVGTYRLIGDLCYVTACVEATVWNSNASAYVSLPFAALQGDEIDYLNLGLVLDATKETPTTMKVDNEGGTAYASLCVTGTSGLDTCTWAVNSKVFQLHFSGVYRVAES
jgi:uncharacterized coiled-coil protein SlyX